MSKVISESWKIALAAGALYIVSRALFDNTGPTPPSLYDVYWLNVAGFLFIGFCAYQVHLVSDSFIGSWSAWRQYLAVFYFAAVMAMMSWAKLGTHIEDADPLFGGGREVVDFNPTDLERSVAGVRMFVLVMIPGAIGFWLARGKNARST